MESDVKQSQEALLLTEVSPAQACSHSSGEADPCRGQREGRGCLGAALTDADAAYLSCSSHLSTHEEGEAFTVLLRQCFHGRMNSCD